MSVIDIRGTSGSGKSWIVRQLINQIGVRSYVYEKGNKKTAIATVLDDEQHTVVLGRYSDTGGGCDGLGGGATQADELVRRFAENHQNIVLEGLMVSHTFERFHNIANDIWDTHYYHFCFMNTPERKCIARVRQRRLAKGNTKPYDPSKNLQKEYRRIWINTRKRLEEHDHYVHVIDHKNPMPKIMELLYEK